MALVQEKNGGPYSKDDRGKRQNEVFRLHFELGYPATKIADLATNRLRNSPYVILNELLVRNYEDPTENFV